MRLDRDTVVQGMMAYFEVARREKEDRYKERFLCLFCMTWCIERALENGWGVLSSIELFFLIV